MPCIDEYQWSRERLPVEKLDQSRKHLTKKELRLVCDILQPFNNFNNKTSHRRKKMEQQRRMKLLPPTTQQI